MTLSTRLNKLAQAMDLQNSMAVDMCFENLQALGAISGLKL